MAKQSIKACSNDLEVVKAAAWAWYQHGSSSEGKPMAMRELDVTRTQRAPGPSRYKLETMRNNNSMEMEGYSSTHNSLLDPYEIESISKRLDNLIELSGIKFYHQLLRIDAAADVDNHPKKKRSSKLKGFLLRRGVVCGRNHDVDETAFKPKNHLAVIKTVNCKPQAAAAAADVW